MSPKLVLNFAFGSNMWRDQMSRRCPESRFIGVAKLEKWLWIISSRGYANVIQTGEDFIYGLVYELNKKDEKVLDGYEGVPVSYTKHTLPVELTTRAQDEDIDEYTYTKDGKTFLDIMVYVNEKDVENGKIKEEYIYRMNQAMKDGLKEGIPKEYFDKYLVPFISEHNSQP